MEDVAETAGEGVKFGLGRLAFGVTMLVSSSPASPEFNPEAQQRIDFYTQRVANRQNVVNREHFDAALREARGQVVKRRSDGQPFDHINELKEARAGLRNDIQNLKAQFGHRLSESQALRLRDAVGRASNLLDRVNRALFKVKEICTGTRICP